MTAIRNTTILFVLLLSACGSAESVNPVSRETIEQDLGLSPGYTETEAADAARAYIHRMVPYDWADPNGQRDIFYVDDANYREVQSGRVIAACGEQAHIFLFQMERLGIKARFVFLQSQLFSGIPGYHQTAEVYSDGKWWLSDPTFNAYVTCNGKRADSLEVQSCAEPVVVESGQSPGYTVEDIWYQDGYTGYFYGVGYDCCPSTYYHNGIKLPAS